MVSERHLSPGRWSGSALVRALPCPRAFIISFIGETGKGKVLVGEVSAVNDDHTDNRFLEKLGRFPEIAEDVQPGHLLVGDYDKFL